MTTTATCCNTWHYCDFNSTAGTNFYAYNCTPQSSWLSNVRAQSPLGRGKISQLAQFADDLGLEPKCYCEGEMAYMSVYSFDKSKLKELAEYGYSIGFKEGDVQIKGEECPCYL